MFSTEQVLTLLCPVLCHLLNDTSEAAVSAEPHIIARNTEAQCPIGPISCTFKLSLMML